MEVKEKRLRACALLLISVFVGMVFHRQLQRSESKGFDIMVTQLVSVVDKNMAEKMEHPDSLPCHNVVRATGLLRCTLPVTAQDAASLAAGQKMMLSIPYFTTTPLEACVEEVSSKGDAHEACLVVRDLPFLVWPLSETARAEQQDNPTAEKK